LLVGIVLGPVFGFLDASMQLADIDRIGVGVTIPYIAHNRRCGLVARSAQRDAAVVDRPVLVLVVLHRSGCALFQLCHIDGIGVLAARGHIGDLPFVSLGADRDRVVALGHRA